VKKLAGHVTSLPVVLAVLLLSTVPLLSVARLSFFQSDYLTERFIGLANYGALIADSAFWRSAANSAIFGLAFVLGEVGIGLPFSLLMFDLSKRWRDFFRFSVFIPTTAAGIVISQVWLWIFAPTNGLANWVLSLAGLPPVPWLSQYGSAMGVIVTSIALTLPGAGIIIMASALAAVPREILEAARVDGASPWQTRLLVALPYVWPTVVLVALIAFIAGAQVWEFVYAITAGGPAGKTQSIMYFVYETGLLRSRYGLGAAASVIMITLVSLWSAGVSRLRKA
jgi:multiple sugar transport system permease protein